MILDENGCPFIDESKRITGLVPYLQRTCELHRKEIGAIIGKIIAPAIVNIGVNTATDDELSIDVSQDDLDREIAKLGISIHFHGDPGHRPQPLKVIEHAPLKPDKKE